MSTIAISFTPSAGTPFYSFTFSEFAGAELPRTYQSTATFSQSANGASILAGTPSRQKFIWAISSPMATADAAQLDEMFRAWDADRASGLAAAVAVVDTTFGNSVTTSAIFSTPPSFRRMSPAYSMVDFGLTEV